MDLDPNEWPFLVRANPGSTGEEDSVAARAVNFDVTKDTQDVSVASGTGDAVVVGDYIEYVGDPHQTEDLSIVDGVGEVVAKLAKAEFIAKAGTSMIRRGSWDLPACGGLRGGGNE